MHKNPRTVYKTFLFVLLFLTVSLVFFLPSCSSGTDTTTAGLDPIIERKLETVLKESVNQSVPGVMIGVWVEGRGSWKGAWGVADLETGRLMTTDDLFRIGSNTKTFTATVILQLVDEGKISLDDPVSMYQVGIPNGDTITIRHLLNMTSGLFAYTSDMVWAQKYYENPFLVWQPLELVEIGISNPGNPVNQPGESYYYSNTNYILLGIIIEKVTGNTVDEEVTRRIIQPLGMRNTVFTPPAHLPDSMPRFYIWEGTGLADFTNQDTSWAWTAGGMVSDLEDMHVYAEALGTGNLISSDMQYQRTHNMVPTNINNLSYGLGMWNYNGYLGHNGGIPGCNSIMQYNPETRTTIIAAINAFPTDTPPHGIMGIFDRVARVLDPNYQGSYWHE